MKIGLCFPYWSHTAPTREFFLQWCRAVDTGPFSSISCGERIGGPSVEMTATLAAAAVVTERVRIVPTLYIAPMHQAVWMAKHAATLDVLSGGRVSVTLGVGGGGKDYTAMEVESGPLQARMEAQVGVMRRVWAGEPPYPGTIPVAPEPLQRGGLPIFAGVMRPKAIARAAHWADGVFSWSGNGERDQIAAQLEQVRAAWEAAGRDAAPRCIAGFWFSLLGDGGAGLRSHVAEYVGMHDAVVGEKMAATMTRSTQEAICKALDDYEELGVEECLLNLTTRDPGEVDRIAELVTRRG